MTRRGRLQWIMDSKLKLNSNEVDCVVSAKFIGSLKTSEVLPQYIFAFFVMHLVP